MKNVNISQSSTYYLRTHHIEGNDKAEVLRAKDRVFQAYPRLGYGTSSSGLDWDEDKQLWKVQVTHALHCD